MPRYDDRPARRRNSRDYDDRAPAPRRRARDDDYDDREPPPARSGGSRGSIIVLDGDRGDDFLNRLFGDGAADEEYDDEDLDDDEEDDAPQDPPARNGHRFFGGR